MSERYKLVNPSGDELLCRMSGRIAILPAGGTLVVEDYTEHDGNVVTARQQAEKHEGEHRKYGVTYERLADSATSPEAGSKSRKK